MSQNGTSAPPASTSTPVATAIRVWRRAAPWWLPAVHTGRDGGALRSAGHSHAGGWTTIGVASRVQAAIE